MEREKVIAGLEHCRTGDCVGCPYDEIRRASLLTDKRSTWQLTCNEQLTEDIFALLKEQEAIQPVTEYDLFLCPVCKNALFKGQKFCHECGKSIEWEDIELEGW